jgi:hypothetical protein
MLNARRKKEKYKKKKVVEQRHFEHIAESPLSDKFTTD